MFYDGGQGEYGAVVEVFVIAVGEIEVTSRPAFATWFEKVGKVGVDCQYHVASMDPDACIGMGGDIVEELVTCRLEGLGAICLA